jgi:glycosyltransferase involved in cell wall biosynthesis
MDKIKIIHIITRLDRGGSSKMLLDIARGLSAAKYDIKIIAGFTINPHEDLSSFSKKTGIEILFVRTLRRDINALFDILALVRLWQIIKKEKPDIVHTHTSKAGFLGRLAAKLAGGPKIIYMPHGNIFYGYAPMPFTKLFIILERFAAGFSDRIVTLTYIERSEFLQRGIGTKGKFVTIHNGIDIKACQIVNQEYALALRRELNIPSDCILITNISRLEPVKGLETFIRALSEAKKTVKDFKALIIGDGSLKDKLNLLTRKLALEDKVLFLGFREDIKEIIYLSDIVVDSALNEGLGLVLLEAGILGKPVVATKVGGIPEVVQDGKTGILVEARDAKALSQAMVRILRDSKLREAMSQQAKAWIAGNFSFELMLEKFNALYEALLKS